MQSPRSRLLRPPGTARLTAESWNCWSSLISPRTDKAIRLIAVDDLWASAPGKMPVGFRIDAARLSHRPTSDRCVLVGGLVDDDAGQRVDVTLPRLFGEHPPRMLVTGPPTGCDAGSREVDILSMVLAVEPRRQQPHEVHCGMTAVGSQLLHRRIIACRRGEAHTELANDVAQPVDLLLPGDMAFAPARILNVLLPAEHLPDRLGLRAVRLPHVDREDQRAAPRLIVEHHLDRRVGIEPAVPIGLAIDPYCRKSRR